MASTHDAVRMVQVPLPLWPGDLVPSNNLKSTLLRRACRARRAQPVGFMLLNSLVMALMISGGKIAISLLSAFAIVYFKFPFRMGFLLDDLHHPDACRSRCGSCPPLRWSPTSAC